MLARIPPYRRSGMKRVLALALVALAFLVGCDDDDSTTGDDPFLVRIIITDPSGAPVEGLQISAAPDLPKYYQDGDTPTPVPGDGGLAVYPSPFYPTAAIKFSSAETSTIKLTVEDVSGRTVDRLIDAEQRPPGQYAINWNGRDPDDVPLPGGVYFAHLILESGGQSRHEERVPMLYVPLYPDQYSIGATDSRGQLNIIDARHFPQLYDLPPIPARDETGTEVGTIVLEPSTRFYALDPATGDLMRFDYDVEGSCKIEVTWDPQV
jgi:hypothetical protein